MIRIIAGDFSDVRVTELLQAHATAARAETGRGSAHALDVAALQRPDIKLWTIWDEETLLGAGALRRLSTKQGEVKSMYVAPSLRRHGAGRAMLRHIIAAARADGLSLLNLETGSWKYFEPARRFYGTHGFVECPPFGDYTEDSNSVFMSLTLD